MKTDEFIIVCPDPINYGKAILYQTIAIRTAYAEDTIDKDDLVPLRLPTHRHGKVEKADKDYPERLSTFVIARTLEVPN